MKYIQKILVTLSASLIFLSSTQAHSKFQYTLTSPNFSIAYNTYPAFVDFQSVLGTDDFLKITITSDEMLQPNQSNPLANASYVFQAGDYTRAALTDDVGFYRDNLFVNPQLNIFEVDSLGVPTNWSISYSTTDIINPLTSESLTLFYLSTNTASFVSLAYKLSDIRDWQYAVSAPGGQWELNQISSPVPEAPEYLMFLAGLGVLGFTARRKKAKNSFLGSTIQILS